MGAIQPDGAHVAWTTEIRSALEDLNLRDPHLCRRRAGARAVRCGSRIVVLLAGVQRSAGALAVDDPDAHVGRIGRLDVECPQVDLRAERAERAPGKAFAALVNTTW